MEPLSRLLYLSVTTLSDRQSLGEEYTGLVQISHGTLPTKLRRLLMILLQTFGPLTLKYFFKNIANFVRNNRNIREDARQKLLTTISYGDSAMDYLNRINVCFFYFHGTFYHLSKRLTGISYVNFNGSDSEATKSSFRLMGCLASLNLLLHLVYGVYRARKVLLHTTSSSPSDVASPGGGGYVRASERCSLCLERLGTRGVTTATACGHLYCWTCILDSLARLQSCPLCRQAVLPARLIPCRNYL